VPILTVHIKSPQNLPRRGSMGPGWWWGAPNVQNTKITVDSFTQDSLILIDGSTFSDLGVKIKITT
jgi:hypothetical protein